MKNRKNIFLLIILLIFYFNHSSGQVYSKGFIFSNKGDTVRGFILIPENNLPAPNCVFKPTMNENIAILSPAEVRGFGTTKVMYVATKFNLSQGDTVMFTRLIFDGIYDLNYFEIFGGKYFIISRPDSSYYTIRYPSGLTPEEIFSGLNVQKKFKLQADSIFPDAPDLPEYQSGVKPDINSFLNLFKQYHNRINTTPAGFSKRTSVSPVNFTRGFIINGENDTIEGLIGNQMNKNTNSYSTCIFSAGKNENALRFSPDDITGFGSRKDNRIFISAKLTSGKDTSAFVRLIFDGSIDLLYFQSSGINHFLLRDPQNKVSELVYPPALNKEDYLSGLNSAKKFRTQADSIFSALGINNTPKPEMKSMVNSLKKYHNTNNLYYKTYYTSKWNFNFGPVAGVSLLKYTPTGKFDEFKAYSDPAPYLGVYLSLTNRVYGAGVFLRNTLAWHRDNYSYRSNTSTYVLYHLTTIKSMVNNLQTGLKISTPNKFPFNPYAEAGPVLSYYISPGFENFDSKVYFENTDILSLYNRNEINSSLFLGYFIRAGFKINCGRGGTISIAGEYDHLKGKEQEIINSQDISATYIIRFK